MTGKEIKQGRQAKGLSQEQLADKVGVSRQTISNIETGKYSKYRDLFRRIKKALE